MPVVLLVGLVLPGAVLAQGSSPDFSVCDAYSGQANGLCHAALAVGCDDPAEAESNACVKIEEKWLDRVDDAPPWIEVEEPFLLYTDCGQPVCNYPDPVYPDLPLCTDQAAGDGCSVEGPVCLMYEACDTYLVCAESDPKTDEEGNPVCAISTAEAKRDIHYLEPTEVQAVATQLLDTRLATYEYKDSHHGEGPRLGFIIEDVAPSHSVLDEGHVDLYGYTSMAVAALQMQQQRIEQLEREVEALKVLLTEQSDE